MKKNFLPKSLAIGMALSLAVSSGVPVYANELETITEQNETTESVLGDNETGTETSADEVIDTSQKDSGETNEGTDSGQQEETTEENVSEAGRIMTMQSESADTTAATEVGNSLAEGTEKSVATLTKKDGTIVGYFNTINEAVTYIPDYSYPDNKTSYTITLTKDTAEDVVIPEGKKYIVLDLAGHTLTNVSSHTITNNTTKSLTIQDTVGGGIVDNITHGKAAVYNNINAIIYLNAGSYTRSNEASTGDSASGGNSFYVLKNFGTMAIQGEVTVKFSDTNPGLYSSLIGNGWQDAAAAEAGTNGEPRPRDGKNKASLKITNGTFIGGQITIKNDDYGTLTVKGGTITQPSEGRAAIANNNVAEITGGTIEAQGINGQAVYSRHFDTNGANMGELTISGGFFKSAGTVIDTQEGTTLTVTDGTFVTTGNDSYIFTAGENVTSSVKNGNYICPGGINKVANKDTVFADRYAPEKDADGNITVGIANAGAIIVSQDGIKRKYVDANTAGKALGDGETLVLQEDYSGEWGITIAAANPVIDLNGYSITSTKDTTTVSNGYAIQIKRPKSGATNHTVTIKNNGNGQSVLASGMYQIIASSGDSKYNVVVKLEGNISVKDNKDGETALGISLDTGAKLADSAAARSLVPNGGFLVKEAAENYYIYGDYANALSKSTDKYVLMLHDYTTNETINSGNEEGILDLGNHTYTFTNPGTVISVNHPNTKFTVKNGKVIATNENCDGVTLVGHPNESEMNNREIVLDGVEITVPGNVYGIVTNGTETGNRVTLKNTILNVKNGFGIYFPSSGDVVIENSVINAKHAGVQMCAGNLTVTGDKTTITVTGQPSEKTDSDGAIADGAAISVVKREGYKELGDVTVTEGTFKSSTNVPAIKAYSFNNTDKEQVWAEAGTVVDVEGGAFSEKVPENLCAAGFQPSEKQDSNGNYTVEVKDNVVAIIGETEYSSLAEAMKAAKDGETVRLFTAQDISGNTAENEVVLEAGKKVTLDLNGCTLKAANTKTGGIKAYGTLVIADSKDTQKNGTGGGQIYATKKYSDGAAAGLIKAIDGGSVIMESGLIDASTEFASDNAKEGQFGISVENVNADTSVVINGGKVVAGWYTVTGNGRNKTYKGTITVNGGELISTADYAIYSPQEGGVTVAGGNITGACGGVHVQRGTLIITGGTITSTGTGNTGTWPDGTAGSGNAVVNVAAGYGGATATITGGTLVAENDAEVIYAGTKNPAEVAVSGGSFNRKVAPEFCADGFAPQENADGTYGVKELAENEYILDSYKGDRAQADWTYPVKEGMTFAGWYTDNTYTTALEATVTTGTAFAKFVKAAGNLTPGEEAGVIGFMGGSLRMDFTKEDGTPDYEKTSLRFGYQVQVPEGTVLSKENTGWKYAVKDQSASEGKFAKVVNYIDNANGNYTMNAVFTGIQSKNYEDKINVQMQVAYTTADGTLVTVTEPVQESRSVAQIARAIQDSPTATENEKTYAAGVLYAIGKWTGYY